MSPIQSPLAQYVGLDGKPLDAGFVYIGEAGQNPETNPITVYWDEAGTQPALQPLRTLNGYIARNGTPTDVYADSDYSTTVRDSHNRLIITKSQFGELANASQIGYGGATIASLLLSKIGHVVPSIEGLRDIDHTKYTNACVTGYYASGDGGGGLYYYDSTDTTSADNGGTVIIADDGARWKLASTECISAKQFGAKGNGVTDDSAAIQTAVNFLGLNGGGRLYCPAGVYLLSASGILVTTNNIWISGDGPGASILRLADAANAMCISIDGSTTPIVGGGLIGVEIDGNRANQTAGVHGVRLANVSNWTCRDFYIHDTATYGIGLQSGSFSTIKIMEGLIENAGGDGIDIKNPNDDNKDILISGVTVDGFGLNVSLSNQAGIDLRGKCKVVACDVHTFGPAAVAGIRLREGEVEDTYFGAHLSSVSDCQVEGWPNAGTAAYYVASRQCRITNCFAANCEWAFDVLQRNNLISNCHSQSCTNGFRFRSPSSLATDANDCVVSACDVRSGPAGDGFHAQADRVKFIGCVAIGMNRGFVTAATADATTLIGNTATSNTANYDNFGTNTINANNTFV